jgi:hypothetical protein
MSHPIAADEAAADPVSAAADPSQAVAASQERFRGWLREFKVR